MNCYDISPDAFISLNLSPSEELAYRRLIDLYHLREKPIPVDVREAARLIRMKSSLKSVESVLKKFFTLAEDGWHHPFCDENLRREWERREKRKQRAKARASGKAKPGQTGQSAREETQASLAPEDKQTAPQVIVLVADSSLSDDFSGDDELLYDERRYLH